MVQKSRVDVMNLSDAQPSNCQLIIKGIKPQQEVDLCTGHCTNLTLTKPLSTQPSNTGPVAAGPGMFSIT